MHKCDFDKVSKALEFATLLEHLSQYCYCSVSKDRILSIKPFESQDDAQKQLNIIKDVITLYDAGLKLPFIEFSDLQPLFKKVKPHGAVLDGQEISAFLPTLYLMKEVSYVIANNAEILPKLADFASDLSGFDSLQTLIQNSIDSEGNIFDNASDKLSSIRRDIKTTDSAIKRKLLDIVKSDDISIFLQDDFITQRSGRWVIPVRMDAKGQVSGVVHDVSHSGETAFIEPIGIIKMSNELENLFAEQKAEEIRILKKICDQIRQYLDGLIMQFEVLVNLDVLNAIAIFAKKMQMNIPVFCEIGNITLISARHPLLMIAYQNSTPQKQVIPLDVSLDSNNRVLIITGSNAGGKTVALKTAGLLVLSAISGLPVSASADCKIPFVRNILVDIGNEQNLQNNMSTFSAHISNLSNIVKFANSDSLVLIDELGTGTDPEEGAAISCALLQELLDRHCLVFCTTHISAIKAYGYKTVGMLTATMEFDAKTHTPLYKLIVGYTGGSHALDIALKYGLPERIIENARSLLGGIRVDFDELIADLQLKRQFYETALLELQTKERDIDNKLKSADEELKNALDKANKIIADAYDNASTLIANIKKEFVFALENIKKLDKQKLKESLNKANVLQQDITKEMFKINTSNISNINIDELSIGEIVYFLPAKRNAKVVDINLKTNRVKLLIDSKEIDTTVIDIMKASAKHIENKDTSEVMLCDVQRRDVKSSLNIIGMRVDPALSYVESFINKATLNGLNEVQIIHGIGTGALKKAVNNYLLMHPAVESVRDGYQSEGGVGVTVVYLKIV